MFESNTISICFMKTSYYFVSRAPSLSVSDGGDSGLDDKDMEASIATVRSLCEQIDADLIWLRERTDTGGKIQDYLIRQRVGEQDFLEVR